MRGTGPVSTSTPLLSRCASVRNRPRPDEAEVAVPRLHREAGYVRGDVDAGAVHVQLGVADPVRNALSFSERDELGADDVAVEAVRHFPVRDRDDDVVEPAGTGGHGG
jgi:hypothetical protein